MHIGVTGVRVVCDSLDLLKNLLEWFLDVDVTLLLSRKDVSPALVDILRVQVECFLTEYVEIDLKFALLDDVKDKEQFRQGFEGRVNVVVKKIEDTQVKIVEPLIP